MLLNLKQIGTGPDFDGKTLDFTHSLDLSAVKLWGEHPFSRPVLVSGRVECRSGIYTIKYTADFEMAGSCARCLVRVIHAHKSDFEHTVLVDQQEDDIADGFIPAPNAQLDLDELVTSDLLLEYSAVMLCGENCRGLCPKCGRNLNEGDCGCVLTEPDPRFDVLRKLINE